MNADYWAFGRFGKTSAIVGSEPHKVILYCGDLVFTVNAISITVPYWSMLKSLIKLLPWQLKYIFK